MTTKAEITDKLDGLGIEYPSDATKAELAALVPDSDGGAEVSGAGAPRPVWEAKETRQAYHARVRQWKLEQQGS